MKNRFDAYSFEGTYYEVGRAYGEELREQIRSNYEDNREKLLSKDRVPEERLKELVSAYYRLCGKYSAGLVEQLKGEGESSGIGDFGAMLLNVSREIGAVEAGRRMECTAYAVGGSYTKDGRHYSGQNQDMVNGYEQRCSMVCFAVTGKPRILFMLPAGNLAFSGMNSEGISCNRNFLFGTPWKFALPRYFSTRMALENTTLEGVKSTLEKLEYPSSHHSLFADRNGNILSCEFDAQGTGFGRFREKFVHTNHFLLPDMQRFEKRSPEERVNSVTRLEYVEAAFEKNKGRVDVPLLKSILSSHDNAPHSVCVHDHYGSSTIASMINLLDEGVMLASKGNPCENGYYAYRV